MKNLFKLTGILALAAVLVSCEDLKSLADVNFNTELQTDLNIDVADQAMKSTPAGYYYSDSTSLDPTSDPEVNKYVSNIKGYAIDSIKITVTQVTAGDVKILSGSIFSIYDDADRADWTLNADFDVDLGNSIILGNDNGQWATVQTILGRNSEFTLSSTGYSSVNDITIVLKALINAEVTANPL
jgi:hypothetical protein